MKKVLAGAAVIAAALAIIGSGCTSTGSESSSSGSSDRGSGASITVVPSGSSCLEDPYNAKIIVTVHLRNSGGEDGEVDVTPVRRYSDSSRNDSFMDTLTLKVPAFADRTYWHSYDYNAEDHSLLNCWAQIDGKNTPISVG